MLIQHEWTPEQKEKRRIIMDAARALFAREGQGNVSMRRLAAKINCSPAIIYRYFRNKEELLHELRREGTAMLTKRMLEAEMPQDPLQKLTVQAQIYVTFGLEMWEYYDLMFHAPLKLQENELAASKALNVIELIKDTVDDAKEHGYFHGHDADTVHFMLWSAVHGLVSLHISGRLTMYAAEERRAHIIQQVPTLILGMALQLAGR